ncbi:hypothetical protein OBP_296 [Pseudomonas phage OBP]|uniref:hypothetical protein n=1 Tax=Pseudomonas phage OBP TaxID=1124849 RepID=UPI000240D643|nr:hypothetical protein OBP_296 [Pseudomonas phage OBP]AEV89733.1 hypothetical protein OBP_296 [Pseudomonas phage OBP]
MEYKKTNRVMLGDDNTVDAITTSSEIINDSIEEDKPIYKGDCEIRFYLGGRPVILHNDTTTSDNITSLNEYINKLNRIMEMSLEVCAEMDYNPDETFLVREFLNPFVPTDRLFGGTLLILYGARYKQVTFDIADCSNKLRRTFKPDQFRVFTQKLCEAIRNAIGECWDIKDLINESKQSQTRV